MKHKIILIIGFLLVLICLVLLFLNRPQPVHINDIMSFRFFYTNGTMMNSNVEYTLVYTDDTYTASIKPNGVPIEDAKTFTVNEDFVDKLESFLRENNVEKWNGFDKTDNSVLDGNRFTLSIYMMDETELYAYGYMNWPKNYTAVQDGIEAIFTELDK